jgi:hypothetical protein
MFKFWYIVVAALALVLLATTPLMAQETANFSLNGLGSGAILAEAYTSPYTGTVNGGPTIDVICDDFADNTYDPEEWTAYETQLSSLTSGTPDSTLKWLGNGSTIAVDGQNLNQAQAYTVAAVLAVELLAAAPGSQVQQDLSYAMWGLFDPTGTSGDPGAFTWLSNANDTTDLGNAETDLNNAVSYVVNSANASQVQADVNAVTIYTYDPSANPEGPSCSGGPCASSPPQEFITVSTVTAPEASTPVLLAVDLLGFMALLRFLRKRTARSI